MRAGRQPSEAGHGKDGLGRGFISDPEDLTFSEGTDSSLHL